MGVFRFKQFGVDDHGCGMKLCTDSVLLGSWVEVGDASRILDLGCGSGVLALMLAQRTPKGQIDAIDINPGAIAAATANFASSPWHDRLNAQCVDAQVYEPEHQYDLIICNPPYFTSTLQSPDADRAQARHVQGLSAEIALSLASKWLTPKGSIAVVTPVVDLVFPAELQRLHLWRRCDVRTVQGKAPSRVLWQFGITPHRPQMHSLDIRLADNTYTKEYTELTIDFYL